MEKLVYFNTLINILLIGWWVYRNNRLFLSTNRSSRNNVLLGFTVMWNSYPVRKGVCASGLFYIPLRNADKVETRENVLHLISTNPQNRRQTLHAKFSWLKTIEEVQQFKKDYSIVDENLVNKLVNEFNVNQAEALC